MGIRRNFVRRNWRIAPYFEYRLGLGRIDAKEPEGVLFAQGQDFTFTMMMGAGARYNFNPRYAISFGATWMHVSNLYLSEPKYSNYGINVYGPIVGIDIRLGKPKIPAKSQIRSSINIRVGGTVRDSAYQEIVISWLVVRWCPWTPKLSESGDRGQSRHRGAPPPVDAYAVLPPPDLQPPLAR
jgi:hypothetical protein